jgi:DNA-binding SARP family transcriptional activator
MAGFHTSLRISAVSGLNVRLFAKFSVEKDKRVLEGFESGKSLELFCYLLLNRDQYHNRETLASLLWDSNSTSQSKKYLRQALWQLQSILQEISNSSDHPILLIEPEWIRVNPEAGLWIDVAEFEAAYKKAHGLQGWQLDAETLQDLEQAVQYYSDDLLLGWYQDWALFERERLQNMFLSILDKLMVYCEAHGEYERGINYGMRILSFDRAHERSHQSLMRLYYLSGDRTAALRQYMRCEQALREELGVHPARRTQELYEIFKADDGLETAHPPYKSSPATKNEKGELNAYLPGVMGQLKELQWILANTQQRVQNDIEAIERALRTQL